MSGRLRAGAASASIGPWPRDLDDGLYLGGFGAYRARRATGVLDEPQCRALALSDDDSAAVIAALDLVGASGPLFARIRDDASAATGVPAERILLACTHSHASPDTQGLWGGTGEPYRDHVARRGAEAIVGAWGTRAPAEVRAATARLGGGLVRNRRGWDETDETLTAVRFTAAADGAPIGTLVNYACHPTATDASCTEVSRDWCGVTADAVQRETGGVCVYVNGVIGDVIPTAESGVDAARALGDAVARAAVVALDGAEPCGNGLAVDTRPFDVPMHIEGLSQRVLEAVARFSPAASLVARTKGWHAASLGLHAAGRADLAQMVAALAGMSERPIATRDGRTYLATRVSHLHVGGAVEAFAAPGEVLTRLGLPLRAALPSRHRLFFGLTHDTLGYFIPQDEWMTGRNNDYEESVSMGRDAGPALDAALRALVPHAEEAR